MHTSAIARFGLHDGLDLAGLEPLTLWWRYLALGGQLDFDDLLAQVDTDTVSDAFDHNLIAQVLNEEFLDLGTAFFPVGYREQAVSSHLETAVNRVIALPVAQSAAMDQLRHRMILAGQRSVALGREFERLHRWSLELICATDRLTARHARQPPG